MRKPLMTLTVTALLALSPQAGDAADPKQASPSRAEQCRGQDLLPELAVSDPAAHARIIKESEAVQNGRATLWRIERTGLEPSFLLGTMHVTDPRLTTLSDKVRAALTRSKQVLLEAADVSPEATANALAQASEAALLKNGQSLDTLLTKAEFEKARTALDRQGMPSGLANVYRPWIVSLLISVSACERERMKAGVPVLDMAIADEAKKLGVPVAGLETVEEQLSAMAGLPDEQQVDMLKATLSLIERNNDVTETLVQLYLDQRPAAAWSLQLVLAEKAGIADTAFKGFREKLIDARNETMRDRAMPHLEKGAAFMAVGALHLPGKNGLVELLRQRGFTVTAVE